MRVAQAAIVLIFRFAVLAAVFAMMAVSAARAEYQARYAPGDRALYVRACFEAGRSLALRAAHREAEDYLVFARSDRGRWMSVSGGDRLWVPASDETRCVRYGVDLAAAGRQASWRQAQAVGESFLVSSGIWLWRPRNLTGTRITIHHPEGYAVSAPWERLARTENSATFRLDGTPADWRNLTAFGRLETFDLPARGGNMRVAVLPGNPKADREKISTWLGATADAVAAVYGRLPLPSPQVLIIPISQGREPVPWAQVRRGGGTAIHLFINQKRPLRDFMNDWTAAHEFSHLLHPYLGSRGRWLGEGLASYYQNIGRARTGLLSDAAAWTKLHAGFRRGRAQTDGTSLRDVNRNMHRNHKYMRVYWSGAAFALRTDVALRLEHGSSLDAALAAFGACHLPGDRMWRVEEFLAELDRVTGSRVFTTTYRSIIDSGEFPDLDETYEALGIRARGSRLRFDPAEPARTLRDAMVGEPVELPVRCPQPEDASA